MANDPGAIQNPKSAKIPDPRPDPQEAAVVPRPAPPVVLPARPGPATYAEPESPMTPQAVRDENLKLFQAKKAAFNGVTLSAETKKGLDELGAVLGITKPSVDQLTKDPRLAAEMRTIKDYEHIVFGNQIMDRARQLTTECASAQAAGTPLTKPQQEAFEKLAKFNEQWNSDSRLDGFVTANIKINSRLFRG